jgi:predicted porin
MYTTSKLVYSSPAFGPIDFGLSYEPTTANLNGGSGNCPYSVTASSGVLGALASGQGLGCAATSSTTSGDFKRRRNVFEALIRLRQAVGPVGVVATIGGDIGGKVNNSSPNTPAKVNYDNFSFLDAGLQLVYGGFMAGAHLDYGAISGNGGWETKVSGEPNTIMWTAGAQYATGPFVAGGSYWNEFAAGSQTNVTVPAVGRLDQDGWAIGGTYQFAAGMNVFLSAVYGARHERGVDLLSGATSSAALGTVVTNNNTKAFGVGLGTLFKW